MTTTLVLQLIGVVLINALSNTTGTLKTIFSTKRFIKPLYVVTFLDTIIFATAMKLLSNGNGMYFIIAFAMGKVIGAYVADIIETKMALGILEVDIFINNKQKMKCIADTIREKGYAANTSISYGKEGVKRYRIEVTLLRKEVPVLEQLLREYEYENPTLSIKEISKVTGKITLSSHQAS
ncbi:hypothetical protein PP175_27860 (plasmid) [Aneurinibacillus sp. Ricciae_BoGa-3]|uniref:hypothetical protein n=1 Tax=Aneurinibacillus sp. Ricciae_BoGa-3 TaxID=3022697 RepID=UPI002342166E|nr:hypothetical protein [Aneurinibacillus sp. Ricciae_BoGa-3]WCK57009.1 hypothetical protein PP175_27860 [Aneurinibacillus sp. Ricciae_BoGa-3]